MPEQFSDLEFPRLGVELSHGMEAQVRDTTREGFNVRTFEPLTDRGRGGQRPGLVRYVGQQLPLGWNGGGSRKIQALTFVVFEDVTALLDDADSGTLPGDAADAPVDNTSGPGVAYAPPGDPDLPGLGLTPDTPFEQMRRRRGGTGGDITPTKVFSPIYDPFPKHRSQQSHIRPKGWGVQPNRNSRKTPQILWADPGQICQGVPLDGTQLNARAVDPDTGADIDGMFLYNPPAGTVLDLGVHQKLHVMFTPANMQRYKGAMADVVITVIDCGGGGGGGGGGNITHGTKVQADVSDLGFNCLIVLSLDQPAYPGSGDSRTFQDLINEGSAHSEGEACAPTDQFDENGRADCSTEVPC